ncbi:MAG: riboflavin kinase / adenylyltransferase [Actinomycetota bacterium]|nr:riboflavin kinase / adenylyltransferase [Actinomycetota bacterium]MDT7549669.1 riboflavin kinase / adenylyltransferase [Actinomycetota bacterium]
MQRWRGVEGVPPSWGRCVVTIGIFDGVHQGHQVIIGRAVELARERGVPSVVLTFDPHPIEIIRPGSHPPVLTGSRHKAELLEALGVDVMCVLPFTPEFRRLTAEEFVHEVLVERLHVTAVVIGENFRYGAEGAGDVATLTASGRRFGFTVEGVPLRGSADTTFSSTYVRSLVDAGDVEEAARVLGREHRVEGLVVRGDQRGRAIGYPTANLSLIPWSAVPADGIYAGRLVRGKELLPAAISIGTNPTFAGRERRVEAFVLDFDEDLYGERVGLSFTARLRDTVRFDTVEALVAQMGQDVERTRELVAHHPSG